MKTDNIKTIEISQNAFEWLKAKYRAVDATDAEAYRTFLAEDCTLMFGNNPVVKGVDEIIRGIQHFWDAISGLDHSFLTILGTDYHFCAESLIDYTRKDGKIVPLPCVTVIERNTEGLASSLKIFIDTSPLFTV